MAQSDHHLDHETRQRQQHRSELAPNLSTVPSGQNAGKASAANNTDTHPFPPCSTWLSADTLDMHCTVDDHRRHCCRILKKKDGSSNSALRARSDSRIRQCGPSTTARLCLQHQHTINNSLLALQLYADHTSQCSFSTKINLRAERWKQEWYKVEFCLQRSSITIWPTFQHRLRHQADQVR